MTKSTDRSKRRKTQRTRLSKEQSKKNKRGTTIVSSLCDLQHEDLHLGDLDAIFQQTEILNLDKQNSSLVDHEIRHPKPCTQNPLKPGGVLSESANSTPRKC